MDKAKIKEFLARLRILTLEFGIVIDDDHDYGTILLNIPEVISGKYKVDHYHKNDTQRDEPFWSNLKWTK